MLCFSCFLVFKKFSNNAPESRYIWLHVIHISYMELLFGHRLFEKMFVLVRRGFFYRFSFILSSGFFHIYVPSFILSNFVFTLFHLSLSIICTICIFCHLMYKYLKKTFCLSTNLLKYSYLSLIEFLIE